MDIVPVAAEHHDWSRENTFAALIISISGGLMVVAECWMLLRG